MPNPFFEAMNRGNSEQNTQRGNPMSVAAMKQALMKNVQAIKANPMAFLIQSKCNVPPELLNNPEGMVDYLLQTKQIDQSRVDWAKQKMAQQGFGR